MRAANANESVFNPMTSRETTMIRTIVVAAALCLGACATGSSMHGGFPVETVDGDWVHLWNVTAGPKDGGLHVAGGATRNPSRQGPVREHLHVEAIGHDSRVLQVLDVPWNTSLSLRQRKTATFTARFEAEIAAAASVVRVRVADGPPHD